MNSYNKYLKYKNKYIELKNKLFNYTGGGYQDNIFIPKHFVFMHFGDNDAELLKTSLDQFMNGFNHLYKIFNYKKQNPNIKISLFLPVLVRTDIPQNVTVYYSNDWDISIFGNKAIFDRARDIVLIICGQGNHYIKDIPGDIFIDDDGKEQPLSPSHITLYDYKLDAKNYFYASNLPKLQASQNGKMLICVDSWFGRNFMHSYNFNNMHKSLIAWMTTHKIIFLVPNKYNRKLTSPTDFYDQIIFYLFCTYGKLHILRIYNKKTVSKYGIYSYIDDLIFNISKKTKPFIDDIVCSITDKLLSKNLYNTNMSEFGYSDESANYIISHEKDDQKNIYDINNKIYNIDEK